MPAPKTEERKLALGWMGMSTTERYNKGLPLNDKEMRKRLGVKASTWCGWTNQYAEQKKRDVYMSAHPMVDKKVEPEVVEIEYNSETYLNDQTEVVDKALIQACDNNNAQALKIYYQLTKRLIEEKKVTIGLTADEIAKQHLGNQQWLREQGYLGTAGIRQVQSEPTLLSE